MFDSATAELIRGAPELEGLDREALPRTLTRVHAWIASMRLRLYSTRLTGRGEMVDEKPLAELMMLQRIADTYEAFVVTMEPSTTRTAAAYVAASAHQLLYRAALLDGRASETVGSLSRNAISPDISALLLYLVAGYPSDALEMAGAISNSRPGTDEPGGAIRNQLIAAVVALATGRLTGIIGGRHATPIAPAIIPELAEVDLLYFMLLEGIRDAARHLLGVERGAESRGYAASFQSVAALATQRMELIESPLAIKALRRVRQLSEPLGSRMMTALITYAGPYHLSRLLTSACDGLSAGAVVNVPTPIGVDGDKWRAYAKGLAQARPYLWTNHQQVIAAGYLAVGVSSVISFPTGSGKSTLSELKAASTLQAGRGVVFLAPTRALVWQTLQSMREAFPSHDVTDAVIGDGAYHEAETGVPPGIVVMTPERCLMQLSSQPSAFADVGLLIFDECHLLHPRSSDGSDRRSVDAMFCLLGLLDVTAECDVVLLSAMISNASELAEWLGFVTQRPCISAEVSWKPTRQVRGCVVYDRDEVAARAAVLRAGRAITQTRTPPAQLKRTLAARPYALFGLTHTWAQDLSKEQYAHLPISENKVPLGTNAAWQLTANKNATAAYLAAQMAFSGIRTLVFVQNKDHCGSLARAVAELSGYAGEQVRERFTPQELLWYEAAVEDTGGEKYAILPEGSVATVHHSLLLPTERRISESVFARPGGVPVMIATPTVAQGMNLPAEAVIIAGEGRFDTSTGSRSPLAAHELLNAAGRAGRAGLRAAGIVLVVPDQLVTTSPDLARIDGPWEQLREEVFSKADQCLELTDPVELILDRIEVAASEALQSRAIRYFITRLPIDERLEKPSIAASRLLRRSLGAFRAMQAGRTVEFQTRIENVLKARSDIAELGERIIWLDRIVSATGLPARRIKEIDAALRLEGLDDGAGVSDWCEWMFRWFKGDAMRVIELLSGEAILAALSKNEAREAMQDLTSAHIEAIGARLALWMNGANLAELEVALTGSEPKAPCKSARTFLNKSVHELSYIAGVLTQVRRGQVDQWQTTPRPGEASEADMPLSLAILAACVREGVSSPGMLALYFERGPYESRVGCHREFREWEQPLGMTRGQSFHDIRERLRKLKISKALESAATNRMGTVM